MRTRCFTLLVLALLAIGLLPSWSLSHEDLVYPNIDVWDLDLPAGTGALTQPAKTTSTNNRGRIFIPPKNVKLETKNLFKHAIDTGKPFYHSQFVLIYDEMKGENQGAPRVILDTSAIRGKMSFKTYLYDGWNHRLDFNAPSEKITTSLQKQIMKNTIFKIEDTYNFNPANEDPENFVTGSFGVSF